MIGRYNLKQVIAAGFALLGSVLGYGVAWLLFWYVPGWVADSFHVTIQDLMESIEGYRAGRIGWNR